MNTVRMVKVVIEETVSKEFEVFVEAGQSPEDVAIEEYWAEGLVLDPGEVTSRKLKVLSWNPEESEWIEFD